ELSDFVETWKGYNARIVIDPLTPVMWSVKEKYQQRDLISFLLRQTRKIGTVLCTLEEHGTTGDLSSPDVVIPMYLADNVIHLKYEAHLSPGKRHLKVIKCRSSQHSKFAHPYYIVKGAGIIIPDTAGEHEDNTHFDGISLEMKDKLSEIAKKKNKGITPRIHRDLMATAKQMEDQEVVEGMTQKQVLKLLLSEYELE
ncbi:MAG TPA: circadian clock protein KaiC, partial [Euryarchaeota archaeon]|nr:circadian clock protein KaiC [Euryarchaeota archaeon]